MPDQQGECAKPWKLFVGQVPKNVQEATIRSFFSPYGEIVHMNILRDRVTQVSKGTAAGCSCTRSASMAHRS
jgi:CUG-BP- and ETR3-like factor